MEKVLSARFGGAVRIAAEVENFYPAWVFRCTVLPPIPDNLPDTVIVRVPREGAVRSGESGLRNEKMALSYLATIGSTLVPRYLAGSASAGFLVSEDLGTAPSLLDLLLGEDAETARQATLTFARGLGKLHTQTARQPEEKHPDLPVVPLPIREHWQQVQSAVAQLGLPLPRGVDHEIDALTRLLADPGCLALSSGDPSVVNVQIGTAGARFFDFEEACFRHPLVDASVLRYLYPTGGPAWQLPLEVTVAMESVYRAELAPVFSFAQEDTRYECGMAAASAAWTILRLARLPRVDAGPDRDSWKLLPPGWSASVPTRSRRRQLVSILETCIASAHRAGNFEAFAAWCEMLTNALRTRWSEASETLPMYPAFRGTLDHQT